MKATISQTIFRASDIRGVYNETLTPEVVELIGKAFGSQAQSQGEQTVIVARDGRLSSPILKEALIEGLSASGCDILDVGCVPTPLLYYATNKLSSSTGVMITGSHNPTNYNGLKMVIAGKTLAEETINALYQRVISNNFLRGAEGVITEEEILDSYIDEITSTCHLARPLKVVVDCGNGIAGVVAPQLLRKLGCEVIELFCDVDGQFPNHHPDPSDPENLTALIAEVQVQKADIGLAYDGDADRLGIVTNEGEIIWPDRQMMLFSKSLLEAYPGAKIIFDVKCTQFLPDVIHQYGGEPIMWKTGHSLIKAKMQATGAKLAGEMSGHIFFNDRWYGFDDAIYASARLLEIISKDQCPVSEIFRSFPNSFNTPELKLDISEERKFEFMQEFIAQADFSDANISTIDGIRVDFTDGFGLVRPSNTTPCLILRFEASTENAMKNIQKRFRDQLLAIDEALELPF
jgi:phosphomannomutase/phosphoglucomutase